MMTRPCSDADCGISFRVQRITRIACMVCASRTPSSQLGIRDTRVAGDGEQDAFCGAGDAETREFGIQRCRNDVA